jgi:UDP-N-acetylmuramate dehydrogenase
LADLTTFKTGGRAKYFCRPRNLEEIKSAILFAKGKGLKYYILGGGSNVLFAERLLNAMVICTSKLNSYRLLGNCLEVECGLSVRSLSKVLIRHALSGMEFAGGLPGAIGGAVFMNARCYGGEFKDIIKSVTYLDEHLNLVTTDVSQLQYGYKDSLFLRNPAYFIYKIELQLLKSTKREVSEKSYKNYLDRKQKHQYAYPSAGCVFKNCYDLGIPAGKLIDEAQLKGKIVGGAKVFEQHANFIINYKRASATDIIKLIELVQQEVFQLKGIQLERELQIIKN